MTELMTKKFFACHFVIKALNPVVTTLYNDDNELSDNSNNSPKPSNYKGSSCLYDTALL